MVVSLYQTWHVKSTGVCKDCARDCDKFTMLKIRTQSMLGGARKSVVRYGAAIGGVSVVYGINLLLALGRDSVLAANFGATGELDALLLGTNFVRTLGIQLALAAATVLVPILVSIQLADNDKLAVQFSSHWLRFSLVVLVPLSIGLVLLSDPLAYALGPGLTHKDHLILREVLIGLAPLLAILGCMGIVKAVADTTRHYIAYPIFLGSMTVGTILGVLIGGQSSGISSAVVGIVAGSVVGMAAQAVLVRDRWKIADIWRTTLQLLRQPKLHAPLPLPIRNVAILLGTSMLVLLQGIIERAYASQLPAGSVTALSLSLSVIGVPSSLLLPAIASVLLPGMARYDQRSSASNTRRRYGLLGQEFFILIMLFAGVSAVFWIGSDLIVRVLFERGKFTAEAGQLTASLVKWFSLALVAYMVSSILRQTLLARKKVILDFWVVVIVLIAEVIILSVLVPKIGVEAIAMENIITMILSAILYVLAIRFST